MTQNRSNNRLPTTGRSWLGTTIVALVASISILPLAAWIVVTVLDLVAQSGFAQVLPWDAAGWWLLAKTLLLAGAASVVSALIGLAPAIAIARGSKVFAGLVICLAAICVLTPSIVHSYAWSQCLRLLGITPFPASAGDIFRCVWTQGCWLWGIFAVLVGLAARRLDPEISAAAHLDGGRLRVLIGSLRGTMACVCGIILLLCAAEFAVFEQTGIRVIATEARIAYDTGLRPGQASSPRITQDGRAALAIATVIPLAIALILLLSMTLTAIGRGHWQLAESAAPKAAFAKHGIAAAAAMIVSVLVPLVALVASLSSLELLYPTRMLAIFAPQLAGTLFIGFTVFIVAALLAAAGAIAHPRAVYAAAIASLTVFTLGGLVLAIAQLQVWINVPAISDSFPIVLFAHLARLAWIPLLAGRWLHTSGWQNLRDGAAVDGASTWQTLVGVLLPIGWPILASAAACTALLAMTEVPANLILANQNPPMLTPMLMTWVHMLRYDDMIVGSLLLTFIAVVLGGSAAFALWVGLTIRQSDKKA